jgi:hypothetical protein
MAKKNLSVSNWLQSTAVRITRVHFVFILAYMGAIIIFDSWNLFTHPEIGNRWTLAAIMLILNTILWFIARVKFSAGTAYVLLVTALIMFDIIFASVNVYWERGLASKAVALFALPIITSACLRSRNALIATTTLCAASYSMATVRYFNLHYGESFRAELYGYTAFYCVLMFVLAGLLLVIIKPQDSI